MIQITDNTEDQEYWDNFETYFTFVNENGIVYILDTSGQPIFADEMAEFIRKTCRASHGKALKKEIDQALQSSDPKVYLEKLRTKLERELLPLL